MAMTQVVLTTEIGGTDLWSLLIKQPYHVCLKNTKIMINFFSSPWPLYAKIPEKNHR